MIKQSTISKERYYIFECNRSEIDKGMENINENQGDVIERIYNLNWNHSKHFFFY